jgi:hypothetical protein
MSSNTNRVDIIDENIPFYGFYKFIADNSLAVTTAVSNTIDWIAERIKL